MTWANAWRLSSAADAELAFQAIYALRQGNQLPTVHDVNLVERARRRVTQSKVLVSFVLALLSFGDLLLLAPFVETQLGFGLPHALYAAGVISAVLLLELILLWWSGIQILPTYLGASILPTIETLPVDPKTLDRVALLLLIRLFDIPALTCLILTPFTIALALGSVWAGVAVIPGVVAVIILAITMALVTGRFFVMHVQGARGGRGQSVLRWSYLILWAVPAFAMYGFVTFAFQFFKALDQLTVAGGGASLSIVTASFPFALATLPSMAAAGGWNELGFNAWPAILGAAAYGAVIIGLLFWVRSAPRRLALSLPLADDSGRDGDTSLRSGSVVWAVLVKDLRTASRTPGYAFLILIPLLDSLALGLSTYIQTLSGANALNLASAAVVTAALLATFFGPAFFAIEVMGYSYTRTLPIRQRSLMGGKVALIVCIYLIAAGLVLGLTVLRVPQPFVFFAFVVAEFPAVIGAAVIEIGLLFLIARRRGLPIVNLYTGAWWAMVVGIPGLFVAGLPYVLFVLLSSSGSTTALLGMATAALLGLAVGLGFTLGFAVREVT
ncbi:MAG: hypothetical protein L3J96_02715 [Thermoplasmata archaeon]|nr:hypothetical protein [Thermoplasmata archaeon]